MKEYSRTGTGRNRDRIARNTHNRNVSSSILDKFPVAGVISDVSTPWKYPAHVVGAVTSGVRAALRPRRAPFWSVSYELRGARTTSVPQKGEESINTRLRETLAFHFLLVTRLRRRPRQSVRAKLLLSSTRREKIEMRTCRVAKNAAICRAVR